MTIQKNHRKPKNMLKKIIINQKIADKLYEHFGNHRLVIDYQAKVNEIKNKDNIINQADIVLTDENGNWIQ